MTVAIIKASIFEPVAITFTTLGSVFTSGKQLKIGYFIKTRPIFVDQRFFIASFFQIRFIEFSLWKDVILMKFATHPIPIRVQ